MGITRRFTRRRGRSARSLILSASIAMAIALVPWIALVHAHQALQNQIDDVSRRIAEAPRDASLYLRRGELHRVHGDWAAAADDFARTRDLDPGLTLVDFCQGKMEVEASRPGQALPWLDRFLGRQPEHQGALALRGRAHLDLGQFAAAAEDYDRAIARSLDLGERPSPAIYTDRARALIATGEAQANEALRGLEQGLDLLGHPVALELQALDIETNLGRVDAALARLDRLIAASSNPGPVLVRRARLLEAAGRLSEARGAYGEAMRAFEALPANRRRAGAISRFEQEARDALEKLKNTAPAGAEEPSSSGVSGG